MPKSSSNSSVINDEANIVSSEKENKINSKSILSGFPSRIKNIFSSFNSEDILILIVLFILIEEGIEDDLLIIALLLLLLTN